MLRSGHIQGIRLAVRPQRKFIPQPPRHLNQAKLTTVDRKICSLDWDGRNTINFTVQDRASSLTFPFSLRRDAGKFISCFKDGGMVSLKSTSDAPVELLVGSDKGILYFSVKGPDSTITTGLAAGDAAIAHSLVKFAESRRLERLLR
jgi:hypothetical protein